MNLNNLYYFSISLTAACMLMFILCFFLFYFSELGKVSMGKDTFLFFDFILFRSGWVPNASAISIAGTFFFGNLFDYARHQNISILYINLVGFIATLLFFIHCRFFSGIRYTGQGIKCVKELLLNINLSPKNLFLWLSRVSYLTLISLSLLC